eukprot:TRINITY_DN25907_c0_g1_i8.p1 TRINITY_DN25907_c0_g1~~TRINITY_DN25907_c0_g1_i8.p1  ORF type:complete len:931 (+),score=205.65 TRINITY_DN25907_c0_g1_i8:117-2909(+)
MSCPVHGLTGFRLLGPRNSATLGQASLCLECIFERLPHPKVLEAWKMAAIEELSMFVFNADARGQRLAGRLLWRTPLLQRTVDVIVECALVQRAATDLLLDFSARCVVEEHEAAVAAGGVLQRYGNARQQRTQDALDAVVALALSKAAKLPGDYDFATVHDGWRNPALIFLARTLASLTREGADRLVEKVESASPLLAGLLWAIRVPPTCHADLEAEAASSILLRVAERQSGLEALNPHLVSASAQLCEKFAAVEAGSAPATTMLALFSLCALQPASLLSCLSGTDGGFAQLTKMACGVQAHLRSGSATSQAAAASLVEAVAAALPEDFVGVWFSSFGLAEWLLSACLDGLDFSAKAAAARATGFLVRDKILLNRVRGFAADVLLDACAAAVTTRPSQGSSSVGFDGTTADVVAPGASQVEARRELLEAAAASLQKILGAACAQPVAAEKLTRLLRAASIAQGRASPAMLRDADTSPPLVWDCLLPVQLTLAGRALEPALEPAVALEVLEGILELGALQDVEALDLVLGTLCALLQAVALSVKSWRQQDSCEVGEAPDFVLFKHRLLAVVRSLGDRLSGEVCSAALLEVAVPAFAVVLWPASGLAAASQDGKETQLWFDDWWNTVTHLGPLVRILLFCHGMPAGDVLQKEAQGMLRFAEVERLLACLLAPALRSGAGPPGLPAPGDQMSSGNPWEPLGQAPPLLLPLEDLAGCCAGLLCRQQSEQLAPSGMLTAAAALHTLARHGSDLGFLGELLPAAAEGQAWVLEQRSLQHLGLRGCIFLAASLVRHAAEDAMDPTCGSRSEAVQAALLGRLACDSAGDEWAVLRRDEAGRRSFSADVVTSVRWLLQQQASRGAQEALLSLVRLEYLIATEARRKHSRARTGRGSLRLSLARCGRLPKWQARSCRCGSRRNLRRVRASCGLFCPRTSR